MACQIQPLRAMDLKHFPSAILFSLLLFRLVASDSSMMSGCMSNYTETINNRTGLVNDKFQVSLRTVLNSLISTSASTSLSFYNNTAGKLPYKSYAIYLCRGDTTTILCRSCVANLTEWVISMEGNCTERTAYSDHCMLRFANYSFIGKADNRAMGYSGGIFNTKNPQVYNRILADAVDQVVIKAAYNSTNLFATYEAEVDDREKVYVLAQCTPDISRGDCNGCLKAAQSDLQQEFIDDGKLDWAMVASCQLRYANSSFFEASPAPPQLVSAFLAATLSLFLISRLL